MTKLDDMTPRRRHQIFAALGVAAVALVVWVIFRPRQQPPAAPHAVPVTVATAAAGNVPVSINALGAAQAWTGVTIFAQVSGKLLRVNFTEGSDVKAGEVLAEIDPAPYQAILLPGIGADHDHRGKSHVWQISNSVDQCQPPCMSPTTKPQRPSNLIRSAQPFKKAARITADVRDNQAWRFRPIAAVPNSRNIPKQEPEQ